MATPAQIATNRRNAGPKTARGKEASSRNATKHGLTAAIASDDVRRRAEIIAAEFPGEGREDEDPARALRLLHLARAEARLERAQKAEREILAKGDDELRLTKELEMIHDLLSEDQEVWRSLSKTEVLEGILLGLKVS